MTKAELAFSTALVAEPAGLSPISDGKLNSMERQGTPVSDDQALVLAVTITSIMAEPGRGGAEPSDRHGTAGPEQVAGVSTSHR